MRRQPMDIDTYLANAVTGPCFVYAFPAGDPQFQHEILFEDEDRDSYANCDCDVSSPRRQASPLR